MADSAPMIRLGDGDTAPVLSYEVPDATSFAGRHYLEIDAPLEHFRDATKGIQICEVKVGGTSTDKREVREIAGLAARTTMGREILLDGGSWRRGADGIVAHLTDAQVSTASAAPTIGPRLAPSTGSIPPGTIFYGANIDVDPETGTGETPLDRIQDAVSEAHENAITATVRILSPTPNAVFDAGVGGADITVIGRVTFNPEGASAGPEIIATLDGETTPRFSGVVTPQFSFSLSGVTPGPHRLWISYRPSTVATQPIKTSRSFTVRAGSGTSVPTLVVEAPTPGTIVVDTVRSDTNEYGAALVRCRATHAAGIANVSALVDGGAAIAMTAAGAGLYTGQVDLFGYGNHVITVTAESTTHELTTATVPVLLSPTAPRTYLYSRLMLVQRVQLTTKLGDYGAGRVVKTFSLLPGERISVSVKTYRRSTTSEKRASTIFDGVESSTADEFTDAIQAEDNNKAVSQDAMSWEVKAKVEQGWGSGHASLSAGLSGSHNASLETFSKNVMNAASKHAANASAKRTMEVNAESHVQTEAGEEETLTREISNINQSRTLNFVFRQMNQEFVSVLHLVDVRIGYAAFYRRHDTGAVDVEYREATIAQLDSFLDGVLEVDAVGAIKDGILETLQNVADYSDHLVSLIERVVPTRTIVTNGVASDVPMPNFAYWRVRRDLKQTWTDSTGRVSSTVGGIVLSGDLNVMRTDGLIVDAVLGGGEALDRFSRDLQTATVDARKAEVAMAVANERRVAIGTLLIENGDADRAAVWATVTPPAAPTSEPT